MTDRKQTPQRPLVMADIARELQLSVSTVSRALRGDVNVSKENRRRVSEKAEEMGYRPHPYVQAFTSYVRGYRSLPGHAPLGLLTFMPRNRSGFLDLYLEGVEAGAAAMGYGIDRIPFDSVGRSLVKLRRTLVARNIRGLVLMPPPSGLDLRELEVFPVAMVTVDYALKSPAIHRATPSYFQNMELALETLRQKGCRRIGFVTHEAEMSRLSRHWLGAYLADQELLAESDRVPVHCSPFGGGWPGLAPEKNWWSARDAFWKWVRRHRPGVVVSNGLYCLDWLREGGFRVPEEVGFAHLAVNPRGVGVSGVDQRQALIGAAAVRLLVQQVNLNQIGVPPDQSTLLVYGSWCEGNTTLPQYSPV